MATLSSSVQPAAWYIQELPDALRYLDRLNMPVPIFKSLVTLKPFVEKIPPFASLHDLIGTFSRLIVAFEPNFWEQNPDNPIWLYATSSGELDKQRLRTLIQAWIMASYGRDITESIVKTWNTLDWSRTSVDLMTADPELQRRLFPGLVARWLVDRQYELTLESKAGIQVMPLRLVPLMSNRKYAELITEPQNLNGQPVSFVLRFWLETMPVTGEPVLLHRVSVRRWMNGSLLDETTGYVNLKWRQGRSVYLRRHSGYLDRNPQPDVFSCIKLRYIGGSLEGLHWVGNQANVFGQINTGSEFPTPQAYASDLTQYQDQLLMPMLNRDAKKVAVSGGLKAGDHLQVLGDLTPILSNFADPMPCWTRVSQGDSGKTKWKSISQKGRKKISMTARYEALEAMPYPLCIELHTADVIGAKSTILSAVGVEHAREKLDEAYQSITTETGRVLLEIIPVQDEKVTEAFPASANTANWVARRQLERVRQQYIVKKYLRPAQITGVLVMLHDYRKTNPKRDPKKALRKGLIQAGRVSQFYTPLKKHETTAAMKHRTESAAGDLLRTLGYRYNPYYVRPENSTLPEALDLMVFWLLQRNAQAQRGEKTVLLPLIVEAPAGQTRLQVYLPRSTGTAELYPSLPEALAAASSLEFDFERPEQTVNFFRSAMEQRQNPNPTLLLLAEQNLRRVFGELNDQTQAMISLNGILDNHPDLRVVRLRFSSHDEVPFCLPGEGHGKYQGLYEHPDYPGAFYSLHNLSANLVKPSRKHRKLDAPKTPSMNPSTVQIWMNNLLPDDNPAEWAALIHRLRLESSHTDHATKYPQPMHEIEIFRKYVDRLADEADDDDDLNSEER